MQTITIEVDTDDGLHLLKDLEKLNILRIVNSKASGTRTKLSDKFKGVFSKEDADSFNQHTQNLRKEWENT